MNVNIKTKYLYHTTFPAESQYWIDSEAARPAPGTYHTSLDRPKYFTLHPSANYDFNDEGVFLRYTVKDRYKLKLLVFTPSELSSINRKIGELPHDDTFDHDVIFANLFPEHDGYMSIEDYFEVMLFRPDTVLTTMKEIPMQIPTSAVNTETLDLINASRSDKEKIASLMQFSPVP